jgi:RNA polymerase sigma-70 factor, ECF subfamily
MIQIASPVDESLHALAAGAPGRADAGEIDESRARLRKLFDEHFEFIWRSLRRLGVPAEAVDDSAQKVFWMASRRLPEILRGKERSFLFGVAVRVAADARKAANRRNQRELADGETDAFADRGPQADELLDRKRARAHLDRFLDGLSNDVRTAFVLFEGEGMTISEIADLVGAPQGTIASRLRIARNHLGVFIERLKRSRGGAK